MCRQQLANLLFLTHFSRPNMKFISFALISLLLAACQPQAKSQNPEKDFDESSFVSSNLPLMVITHNGNIKDEPKTLAKMKLINSTTGNYLNEQVTLDYGQDEQHSYMGIEIRGFGSKAFAKKQYSLELWTDDEDKHLSDFPLGTSEEALKQQSAVDDQAVKLLGLEKEEDWVLYAPYSDKSLMRNVIAYQLANNISQYWHPKTKFVEVFFEQADKQENNLDYRGVYVLTEKIKRDKNRLNINKLKSDEVSGEDLTGGYLLEVVPQHRLAAQDNSFTNHSAKIPRHITIEYPKKDDLQPEQLAYISNTLNNFVDILYQSKPVTLAELEQHADIDSFINFLLINELFKNRDAFYASTYFHKDKNEKIVAGPVWDFNLSSGNDHHATDVNTSPEGWFLNKKWLAERLFTQPDTQQLLKDRWQQLRKNEFSDDTLNQIIDHNFKLLDQGAAERNFTKWDVLGSYIIGNQIPDSASHIEEVEHLRNWLLSRVNWIDQHILLLE